jgi:hypothetical protein
MHRIAPHDLLERIPAQSLRTTKLNNITDFYLSRLKMLAIPHFGSPVFIRMIIPFWVMAWTNRFNNTPQWLHFFHYFD